MQMKKYSNFLFLVFFLTLAAKVHAQTQTLPNNCREVAGATGLRTIVCDEMPDYYGGLTMCGFSSVSNLDFGPCVAGYCVPMGPGGVCWPEPPSCVGEPDCTFCPPEEALCGGQCCNLGEQCIDNLCCPLEQVNNNGQCTACPQELCNGVCCPAGFSCFEELCLQESCP
jgi:hypothetical protein